MAIKLKDNPEPNSRTAKSKALSGKLRCDINMGEHDIVIDEPPERGGDDTGASPLYHFCAALSACQTVQVAKVAQAMRVEYGEINIDTTLRTGKGAGREQDTLILRCLGVDMKISVQTSAKSGKLERLKTLSIDRCPIGALVDDAGVELNIVWEFPPMNNLDE